MIILTVTLLITSFGLNYAALPCCSNINRNPACKRSCEELTVNSNEILSIQQLITAARDCPEQVVDFWKCVNSSFPVIGSLDSWFGKPCCSLAVSRGCKEACYQAQYKSHLQTRCRRSDELNLYRCLERSEEGEKCCSLSQNHICGTVCRGMYLADSTTNRQHRDTLKRFCVGPSINALQCIQNNTKSTPARNPTRSLPCCEHASTSHCRDTCIRVLTTLTTDHEIIDELIRACDNPDLMDPLWQCFIYSGKKGEKGAPSSTIDTTGIDSAKLQCCAKAVTSKCRNLCIKTYSKGWTNSWNEFHQHCHRLQSVFVIEASMHMCLKEVEEPCALGCNNMDYCTNFNARPTELFRSCSSQADKAAENDIEHWRKGVISLPQMTIHVRDIAQCEPEMWKAIACALRIQPCHRKQSPVSICREDCVHILTKCIDQEKLYGGQTVGMLCNSLPSAEPRNSCVSVTQYLDESQYKLHIAEISTPCSPNPCATGHVCQINRRKCKHQENCLPYVCKAACPLGEVSTFLVPRDSYVRIPMLSGQANCNKICRCGHRNVIDHCRPMVCLKRDSCLIGGPGQILEHGNQFKIDCNNCICHSGELICTKKKCPPDDSSSEVYTGLPCNCPNQHMPVCGANGKTYPNSCLAKCSGLSDNEYELGGCWTQNPCSGISCGHSFKCVTRRQVCLSLVSLPCPQYECILTDPCNHHHHEPVCSTANEEFTNACLLQAHNHQLAYRGHCRMNCDISGSVCAYNGETYDSECAALADRTLVDYVGTCNAVGRLAAGDLMNSYCADIKCPEVRPSSCVAITPPGGCCPVCAAEVRALFSQRLTDMVTLAADRGPLTVENITRTMSSLMTIAECDVFGYLSIEGDVVILICVVTPKPTVLQVKACNSEAERLEYLIRTGSPTVLTHLALTPLLSLPVRTPFVSQVGAASVVTVSPLLWLALLTTLLCTKHCLL